MGDPFEIPEEQDIPVGAPSPGIFDRAVTRRPERALTDQQKMEIGRLTPTDHE